MLGELSQMSSIGNNYLRTFSETRDSFFTPEERSFYNEIMQSPTERCEHNHLKMERVEKLYEKAMELINRVETGEFGEDGMDRVEYYLVHLLGAIEDIEKSYEKYFGVDAVDASEIGL